MSPSSFATLIIELNQPHTPCNKLADTNLLEAPGDLCPLHLVALLGGKEKSW
jgi:hypothetical protein